MDLLLEDIRYGVRQLIRQRGSSSVAILTLALGIGISTAIVSVIDATMLRPLPYPDPEQLVSLYPEEVEPDGRTSRPTSSMEDMRTWQAATDAVSVVAGWSSAARGRIVSGAEPERLRVLLFTEAYLSMHGVTPILGRDFRREDCEPGGPLVALLGYGYWQSRYGGRTDVLGATITLEDDVATVVGVLPASFNATTAISLPLQIPASEFSRRGTGGVNVFARLLPGVSIEQARARLSSGMSPGTRPDGSASGAVEVRASVTSRLESTMSRYRTTVNVLAAAVGLILLIACVNVGGLLLARGAARQSELAIRASLGAKRVRLIRQLLTECALLALIAGVIGVLLAWATLDVIVANVPLTMPDNSPVTLNLKVLGATAALLIPTTLIFGLVPAIRLSRTSIGFALARNNRQVGSSLSARGGQWLIASEVALAVVLVAGAGLMIRSFVRISGVDLGFSPDGLVTMEVLPLDRTPAAHKEYYRSLLRQVRTTAGVSQAGLVDNFPLGGSSRYSNVSVAGKRASVTVFETAPGYFETVVATLRAGRFPSDADDAAGLRGVVINETAARALFPDGRAVGSELVRAGTDSRPWTVLGVIADFRHGGPIELIPGRMHNQPHVFFPLEPTAATLTQARLLVMRPSPGAPALADQLRRVAQSIGPALVERIRTGEEWFGQNVITPKRRTVLLVLLGALGLILALVGVFGMTAYSVTRRTAEIGVRMAFGARPSQVVRRIVRDAAYPILIGTVVGVVGASFATRIITTFLFQTAPTDPVTFAAVAVTLIVTGGLAALIPALRAAQVDPASCLRSE